jgi:hypothetical protein
MVYTLDGKQVKTNFKGIAEFITLSARAKELSQKIIGAEDIQQYIDNSTLEISGDLGEKIVAKINIVDIFWSLEDLLSLPIITSQTLEYYGLINYIFRGLEFEEGF